MHHAHNHTGHRIGETHPRARYSDATVREARRLRSQGMTYGQISQRLGVGVTTLEWWCNYKTRWNA